MKEKELILKRKLEEARLLLFEAEELSKEIISSPEYNTDRDYYSNFETNFWSFASQISEAINQIDAKIEYDNKFPW